MEISKGKNEDIKSIMHIIKEAVIDMEAQDIHQWDEIYPDEPTICDDIYNGNLYVYIDNNKIKGLIVLNENQDKQYETLRWKFNSGAQLVIHRLCVDPQYQGKGIAKALLKYAETYGKQNQYTSIRLDAFIHNIKACSMYEKAGYNKTGSVIFRKGDFYCYEKGL